jgi:hypothetical protein
LTIPVSVASDKQKLIKTYIHFLMLQERLVGQTTLSVEHEIAQSIDLKEVVSHLQKLKVLRVKFWLLILSVNTTNKNT